MIWFYQPSYVNDLKAFLLPFLIVLKIIVLCNIKVCMSVINNSNIWYQFCLQCTITKYTFVNSQHAITNLEPYFFLKTRLVLKISGIRFKIWLRFWIAISINTHLRINLLSNNLNTYNLIRQTKYKRLWIPKRVWFRIPGTKYANIRYQNSFIHLKAGLL